MTRKLSRREFIKTASIGAAATAVLTGCGPASRYVVREPYTRMPEYTYNGQSTYYASTCRECPCGCGIVVRTEQGRALKVEGNPKNPINQGKTCSRGQAALQGLYNPDRIKGPTRHYGRGSQIFADISWDEGIEQVKNALRTSRPDRIAFLLGMAPDHLFDLVSELCEALGAPRPIRYGAHEIFEGRLTLAKASQQLFSANELPYFDLANADVTFSFGANFLETYISPMAYSRGFAHMRRGTTGKRGYLVQFEPRLSQTAATADEWIPLAPGSDAITAAAIGRMAAEIRGGAIPNAYLDVDIEQAVNISGLAQDELERLARMFAEAEHPLAIPGGSALGRSNGLESAQAVLALNVLAGNLGQPGGLFLNPTPMIKAELPQLPSSVIEVNQLIDRMRIGEVKTLFIHGINPLFELPAGLGFEDALSKVSSVISFSSFPDETSMMADVILPDHTGLESWGYQRTSVGADQAVISSYQPTVAPFYDTRATADVLLAAVQSMGGEPAAKLPFMDEVEYLQNALLPLVDLDGTFNAPEIRTFMAKFQQLGGWWSGKPGLATLVSATALTQPLNTTEADFDGTGNLYMFPYMSPILGDGSGANKPWLQETPDPTTTVMWNSWIEISPETAHELEVETDDVVKVISPRGEFEAIVYVYPGIRPDTVAIPFGQGHSAYGRYAQGRGINPINIISLFVNGAEDLAYGATKVQIEKTGRKQPLSRLESNIVLHEE